MSAFTERGWRLLEAEMTCDAPGWLSLPHASQMIAAIMKRKRGARMAAATLVSVAEYLKSSYRPDQEMIEGQLVQRNIGEYDHSNLQGMLVIWMGRYQREWKIRILPEQRMQVAPDRFRIPDICVISRDYNLEPVFTKPPLLVVEILSKDDTLRSMQDRIDDYRAFGIPNIWVLDPVKRRAYVCTQGDFRDPLDDTLQVPGSLIRIPLKELFAELD